MKRTLYAVGARDTGGRRLFLTRPTWRRPSGWHPHRDKARLYRHFDDADRAARAAAANAALLAEVTVFAVEQFRRGARIRARWHELNTATTRAAGAPVAIGPATGMMAAVRPNTGEAA